MYLPLQFITKSMSFLPIETSDDRDPVLNVRFDI